ncbi:hypothetical protein [Phytohabitans aurantiacus]|nr:hypothetical protein [Phytohabitans aurantiacus]
MTTYRILLAHAASALAADGDPDGAAMRQALLLAVHAGLHRPDGPGGGDWDLYTVAITEAVRDLGEPAALAAGLPDPAPDGAALRRDVAALVRRLAERYAAAAAGERGSPWRRLVWARVAHRLDDAVAELR